VLIQPRSRKVRALQETLGKPAGEIVQDFAGRPESYEEIARVWEAAVKQRFPELAITFNTSDVYRLFNQHGVRRGGSAAPLQQAA
jgi:hypothetical protein